MVKYIAFCFFWITGFTVYAQAQDPVLGRWENPSGEGRIEIVKSGDEYTGKLYWIKEPNGPDGKPKKDENNPDESKRSRPLQGLQLFSGFKKTGDKVYEEGEIYDPKSGKTYSCKMTVKGSDRLDIRGYVGVSLIGRTETFKKVK